MAFPQASAIWNSIVQIMRMVLMSEHDLQITTPTLKLPFTSTCQTSQCEQLPAIGKCKLIKTAWSQPDMKYIHFCVAVGTRKEESCFQGGFQTNSKWGKNMKCFQKESMITSATIDAFCSRLQFSRCSLVILMFFLQNGVLFSLKLQHLALKHSFAKHCKKERNY